MVNYLSNPDVEFKSHKTGSVNEDNARVLTETRFRSAAVGDESMVISECTLKKVISIYHI